MLLRNKKIVGGPDPVKNIGNLSPEVLVHIFSFLDSDSILNCRLVSKQWKEVIEEDAFRHLMDKKEYLEIISRGGRACKWETFFLLWKKKPLGKNLLVSNIPPGPRNLDLVTRQYFHSPPYPIFNFPPLTECRISNTYFVLGRGVRWTKYHVITLKEKGLTTDMLDTLRPTIEIRVWYALREETECKYLYSAELLTERQTVTGVLHIEALPKDGKWRMMSATFEQYGKGVAYVRIRHQVITELDRDPLPQCIITGEVLRVYFSKPNAPTSPVDHKETILSMFD